MTSERVTQTAPTNSTQPPERRTLYRCPELADLLEELIANSDGASGEVERDDGALEHDATDDSEMDWAVAPFAGGRTVTFVPVEAEPLA